MPLSLLMKSENLSICLQNTRTSATASCEIEHQRYDAVRQASQFKLSSNRPDHRSLLFPLYNEVREIAATDIRPNDVGDNNELCNQNLESDDRIFRGSLTSWISGDYAAALERFAALRRFVAALNAIDKYCKSKGLESGVGSVLISAENQLAYVDLILSATPIEAVAIDVCTDDKRQSFRAIRLKKGLDEAKRQVCAILIERIVEPGEMRAWLSQNKAELLNPECLNEGAVISKSKRVSLESAFYGFDSYSGKCSFLAPFVKRSRLLQGVDPVHLRTLFY
jgi:hypothetical protein